MRKVYLDYAATTPTDPLVVEAMLPYFTEQFGNASSIHSFGGDAMWAVDQSRQTIASFVGAMPEEIIFTSGGTESNNYAIKGVALAMREKGNHIITSPVEHPSVAKPSRFLESEGFSVTYLPVDQYGMVNPDDVKKAIRPQTTLISIMHANNEVGTIQPIPEISRIARSHGIAMHTDAVQTFAHLPFTVDSLGVDLMSVSGHKLYGPKGVGFLYVRKGIKQASYMHGGSQEMGRRASTYNTPGIVGLGRAVELAANNLAREVDHLTALRTVFIDRVYSLIDNVVLNGHPEQRLPNNVSISVQGVMDELLLMELDAAGIACSMGSACKASAPRDASQKAKNVLNDAKKGEFLRFSLGRNTTEADIAYAVEVLSEVVVSLRNGS